MKSTWKQMLGASAVAALASIGSAHANVITQDLTLTASGPGSVGYFAFSVSSASQVTSFTSSVLGTGGTAPFDPVLGLFRNDGVLDASDFIASNDDGCPVSTCGPAVSFFNAIIVTNLTAGNYLLAVGDFPFTLAEVLSGQSANARFGPIRLTVSSPDNVLTSQVPLPGTAALFGLGLVGLAGLARRAR